MNPMGMILIQALILGVIVTAVLGFIFIKVVSRSTETHVSRLNRETEAVRSKQAELNQKIKDANEELQRRRSEADDLVSKMKTDAEEAAKDEVWGGYRFFRNRKEIISAKSHLLPM